MEDNEDALLERAIAIAVAAHAGQRDKAGAPYILHPLRVMQRVSGRSRIAAVLHDVVEDNADWTFDRFISEGFPEDIVTALRHLTKTPAEDAALNDAVSKTEKLERYLEFVKRAAMNPIAKQVKIADLTDNSDRARYVTITAKDEERLERYRAALAMLGEANRL